MSPSTFLRCWVGSLVLAGISLSNSPLQAEDAPADVQKKALAWLDDFAVDQVLFHPKDVQKLHDKVAKMTPEEAAKWWDKTAEERKLFDSEDWQETRAWLKEFLKVQAIYSDEQIRYFQSEAFTKAKEGARSLKEVMDELSTKRRELATASKQSAAIRKQLVASAEAYHEGQVRQREAALANAPPPMAPAPPPTVRRDPVPYNQPLITSLDAARWGVLRAIYPRW